MAWTKEYTREYFKEYYKKNKDKIREQNKEYYLENVEKIREQKREYQKKNKNKIKEQRKASTKKYEERNKEKIREQKREYRDNNKDKLREYQREYKDNNRKKLCKKRRIYQNKKYKTDVNFKIRLSLSKRINKALKGNSKSWNTQELLGCSIDYFKHYLENQFTLGMNWKNYGYGWNIDHILPCSSFNLSTEENQLNCFNYSNMQPLWKLENLRKSNKIL